MTYKLTSNIKFQLYEKIQGITHVKGKKSSFEIKCLVVISIYEKYYLRLERNSEKCDCSAHYHRRNV